MSSFQNVQISRDESAWEIDVRAELSVEALERYRDVALKSIQKDAKLDGFRPGKAPLERIIEIYGESTVLKRAVEEALGENLPELLAKENALIVESPRVTISELQRGKPVGISARAALAPSVELPDYKSIARSHNTKKEEMSVSDEEHKEAMTHFRRERARIERIEKGTEPKIAHEESRALKEEELPALDDEFVKALGIAGTEKFSETVRTNIKNEKELAAREKRRAAILDELAEKATIKFPAALREYELDDMEARMKHDLERMGTSFDAYLVQTKKTRDELRAEWKDAAYKRAKVRLILAEIARKEDIEPDNERLEKELAHAKQHIQSANDAALRAHITHALRNEKVLEFLESIN